MDNAATHPWEDSENEGDGANTATLIGSDNQPPSFELGGQTVPLGDVVAYAHAQSGLSIDDWNDLDEVARDSHIQAVVDAQSDNTVNPDVVDETVTEDIDALKLVADELKVSYGPTIKYSTLLKRVDAAKDLAANPEPTDEVEAIIPAPVPAPLDSTGQPQTGAQLGANAHVDPAENVDGTEPEQAERLVDAGVVISGEQASLALANLVSQGVPMAEARKRLAAKGES